MKKVLIFFVPFMLIAQILSPLQIKLLNEDYQKTNISADKLKDSWINPINLEYKYNKNNQINNNVQTTNQLSISINQPIFKSGAIWQSIKYANFIKEENLDKVKLQKQTLIKQAYEILFNIKKTEVAILKQKLLIENADIDIQRKKEQFLSGVSDSSFLDNAIINKNNLELALKDLSLQKESLINNFKNLSDLDYHNITLPKLTLIQKNEYLKNLNLKIMKKDIKVKKTLKDMNIANQLLKVNLIASYNYLDTKYDKQTLIYKNDKINFYNMGIAFSLPLNINSLKTIEEAKIDYLKTALNYQNEILKAKNEYNSKIKIIDNLNQKIKIYNNTINTYASLIKTTKDNIKAGINTNLDLKNLENSKKIAKLTIKDLEFQKEIELLHLYYITREFK